MKTFLTVVGTIALSIALWFFAGWMEYGRKWRFPWERSKNGA